jgi:xylan 1,4-beta-xylosidase
LTIDGVRKPAYHAFRFAASLGHRELENSDPHSWVCSGSNGVQALFWNVSSPVGEFSSNRPPVLKLRPPGARQPVSLQLAGLRPGSYQLRVFQTGYGVNDPYTAYLELGCPERLARAQLDELNRSSSGTPLEDCTIRIETDGTWERLFPMRENDVFLVLLNRKPASEQ